MKDVFLPDEAMLDMDEPYWEDFGEPYAMYYLSIRADEDGRWFMTQGVSVSLLTTDGRNLPLIIGGATLASMDEAVFLTPEVVLELVRRVQTMIRSITMIDGPIAPGTETIQ